MSKKGNKLDISNLTTERKWHSVSRLTKEKFEILLGFFQKSYESIYGKIIKERTSESFKNPTMRSYSKLLFFTFLSLKSGITYDLLGFVRGIDGSMLNENKQGVSKF